MKRRRPALTIVEVLVVLVLLALLACLLLPATRNAREVSRRNSCRNNLKQINFALHNHFVVNDEAPPAYTVDAEGNRLHSWRTRLLPFLEEQSMFDRIDPSKPWDDPINAAAHATQVIAYSCVNSDSDAGMTTYLAVVGPECAMSGSVPWTFNDIADGLASTVWLLDAGDKHAVHWMNPNDLAVEEVLALSPNNKAHHTNHPGVLLAGFADGHVESIDLDTPKEKLQAMLTAAAGDSVPE